MSDVLTRLTQTLADRYRLERELGAGGMATVYLAHDIKHERDVAIKVLHPDLGAALGAERFLSEIKTTAKLQHPHILPLLDSGAADGLLYYVMPFVRGETLRARLEREKQLSIEDALRIAREVASALEHAHKQGIIHRDIKPENILLQDGAAVVADFGIALAVQSAGGARMTQTGLSLGTPQYMSPEQAMGERTIDARSDIYALGAVTYEMLAGEPPFTGPSTQAIVAKVLSERPISLRTVRDTVPDSVDRAVLQALAKLPADRFANVIAFAAALGNQSTDVRSGASAIAGESARSRMVALSAGVGLLALSVAGVLWFMNTRPALDGDVVRFVLERAPGEIVRLYVERSVAISPLGDQVAVDVDRPGVGQGISLRQIDRLDAELTSPGGSEATFSPDGSWLAIWRNDAPYKLPVRGGEPIRIPIDLTLGRRTGGGWAWAHGDQLVWECQRGICAADVGTGATRVVAAEQSATLQSPLRIAGKAAVLLTRVNQARGVLELAHLDLEDGAVTSLGVEGVIALGLVDDALVYVAAGGDIMAVRVERDVRKTRGAPVRVTGGVLTLPGLVAAAYAALSDNGHLVYHDAVSLAQLVRVSAQGEVTTVLPDTQSFEFPRWSPDGRRIALDIVDPQTHRRAIWVLERATGILSRLTEATTDTDRERPEWTPDGESVLYRVARSGRIGAAIKSVSGGEAERDISAGAGSFNEVVMLPDGRTLLARVNDAGAGVAGQRLWRWALGDTAKQLLDFAGTGTVGARVSPDGQWLAFVNERSGIFVTSLSGTGPKVRVNRSNPGMPVWRRDSRALFVSHDGAIDEITLKFEPDPMVVSTRRVTERVLAVPMGIHAPFDVGPQNDLLGVRPIREPRTIMVRNFAADVRRALAGGARQ